MSQGVRESGGRTRPASTTPPACASARSTRARTPPPDPRPAPGRWLRAFLAAAALGAVIAVLAASPAAATPTCDPPTLSGSAAVGGTLTGTAGACSGLLARPATLQWFRCSGATAATCAQPLSQAAPGPVRYTPTAADAGRRIMLQQVGGDLLPPPDVDNVLSGPVNSPPVASFSISPASAVAGRRVTFASASRDPDGDPLAHAWDLDGDGRFDDGTQPTVTHSYRSAGTYPVALRVTAGPHSSLAFKSIAVAAAVDKRRGARRRRARLRLMSPFPLVAIGGRLRDNGALVTLLRVRAPRRARVTVRCRGRGCPVRRWRRSTGRRRVLRVRRFERELRAGVVLVVRITARNRIGKHTRIKIRRGAAPARRDRCLIPHRARPVRCPRR